MPVITPGVVTHINVFTTTPDTQQRLVDSLIETVKEARTVPGWLSASVHRGFDGYKVVNYVQYDSKEAAQRVTRHLLAKGLIQRNIALGSVSPGEYEVAYVLDAVVSDG